MMRKAAALLGLVLLSGCAQDWTSGPSYVGNVRNTDTAVIANSIADFVKLRIHSDSSVRIEPASGDTTIAPAVQSDLTLQGYTVSPSGSNSLKYAVQSVDDQQILVMAFLNQDTVGTRLFARDAATGQLHAAGPIAVREPVQ